MEIWVYALCVIPNIFCEFYRSYLAKHNCFIEFALEKFNYMKVGRMKRKAFKSAQVKKGVQFFDLYFVEDLFFFFVPLSLHLSLYLASTLIWFKNSCSFYLSLINTCGFRVKLTNLRQAGCLT